MSISPPAFPLPTNHAGGFQADDTECANCHIPQGETPFDASILGAHVVPTDTAALYPQNPDTLLAGFNLAITSVTNTTAGKRPRSTSPCRTTRATTSPYRRPLPCHSPWPVRPPTTAPPISERHLHHSGLCDGERHGRDLRRRRNLLVHFHARHSHAGHRDLRTMGGEARMTVTVDGRHHFAAERRRWAPTIPWCISRWMAPPVAPRRTVVRGKQLQ
jgi:hypothetical protein